jgi:hypothetical protein
MEWKIHSSDVEQIKKYIIFTKIESYIKAMFHKKVL